MLNPGLIKAIESGTVSHAYIFFDEDAAFEFAKALNPLPADQIIQEDLLTKDIENLQANLKIKPFGDIRVVIIKSADKMQTVVQNKLLKTLEEPLGNTVLILTAERRDAFLPTILSRCIEVVGTDKAPEFTKESESFAKQFIASNTYYKRKALVEQIEEKEEALIFLDALLNLLREDLIKSLDSARLRKQILTVEDTRKSIEQGFSLSFALKALALDM